ncbi:hypothetical protein AB0J86_12065 [Micromonospora sp. NPDC049559]|uniref:hypothetical protein n=1 Tax=Micromonospora sp. NPDC049559 TaxID=3155923 RepID=UPI00343515DA
MEATFWIGGSPCAGKSTVAARLAADRGATLYSCDEAFERHAATVDPERGRTLRRVVALGIEERLGQPVDRQVDDLFRLYVEEFPLILADLARIAGARVPEGAALLPELLAARRVAPDRAVWIVPTGEFQRRHYRRRRWAWELLASLPEPEWAFDRWMRRDELFASRVAEQARDLGYPVIVVDGTAPVERVTAAVRRLFDRSAERS